MAKTKFFRVAVEGETVDGRAISKEMIQQMADSYKPATYTARINCEHLRGYSPEGPFNAWGSVDGVKAEQVDLEIGGKTEKRLALFASFDVTDQAQTYNKAGQKLFSSIEIQPNFAGTGKAYLVGLAFTDSPASLGTEVLKFSRDDARKDNLVQVQEFELAYDDAAPGAADAATGAFSAMRNFFEGLANFGKTPPAVVPPENKPADPQAPDMGQFAAMFGQEMTKLGDGLNKSFTSIEASLAALREDHNKLKADVDKTPSRNYTARPNSNGGTGAQRAEC